VRTRRHGFRSNWSISEYFHLVADAIFAERKIKGWSRAKKEALIRGDWAEGTAPGEAARRKGRRATMMDPSRFPG
jgi:predicted GIY-YIG superfamily endonuclease